jgi:hypothetical protein
LVRGLQQLGFVQSTVDECVFYYGTCVLLVYVNDTIVLGPLENEVQRVVERLRQTFNIGEEGDICEYLGIKVTKRKDNTITLTQPHLIESILKDLKLHSANAKGRITPALSSVLLHQDLAGNPFDESFHYRKLNFLEKSTRPEIAYAVHQCTRFTANPRKSHGEAVKRIGRYLLATKERGIILQPSREKLFDCWVDTSHAGEWNKKDAMDNPDTAKSRTGYVFMFANCPIIWASKTLSSAEAEYIALSTATREVIPLLHLMKEAKENGVKIDIECANFHRKIFEDNAGAIELAKTPKMRPRTKHLNIKYHHFRQHVQSDLLSLHYVPTNQQIYLKMRECGIYSPYSMWD